MQENRTALFLQAFGLGDNIFAMGVCEHFIKHGYKIIYPVKRENVEGLSRAYPQVTWMPDTLFDPALFLRKDDVTIDGVRIVPIRWSNQLLKVDDKFWMRTKFDLYNLDYTKWKEGAKYERSKEREEELYYDVCRLKKGSKYNFLSTQYGQNKINLSLYVENGLENISMSYISGFSMFDWSMVIENATHIHAVNSSILYLLELLKLKAKETHLYVRKGEETDFKYVDYLFTKEYTLHY